MNLRHAFVNLSLMVTLFITSCDPIATFDTPQPKDVKNETSIPKKIRGIYRSLDTLFTITITDTQIIESYNEHLGTRIDSLDFNYLLSADTLINLEDNATEIVQLTDSSIIQHYHYIDTIFRFENGYALKKYKGYYIINRQNLASKKWNVTKLGLHNDTLTLASIGLEDLTTLGEITQTTLDTNTSVTNYDLSKKEFNSFVKTGGFQDAKTFIRISK